MMSLTFGLFTQVSDSGPHGSPVLHCCLSVAISGHQINNLFEIQEGHTKGQTHSVV